MAHAVTLIRGDGTGPELAAVARRVLDATGVALDWVEVDAGLGVLEAEGTALPERVLESVRETKTCLKAPTTTPRKLVSLSVGKLLCDAFELFASVRPCKSYLSVPTRFENVDLVVFRENTEGLCAGIEFARGDDPTSRLIDTLEELQDARIPAGAGIAIKAISSAGSARIIEAAFEYARRRGRRKLTTLHRSDVLRRSDGLFLHAARNVAVRYPEIEFEDRTADEACLQLVREPASFDVLVMPDLYADLVSHLGAGLVGGLGMAPSMSLGEGEVAMFEPVHGPLPECQGQNRINPCAMLLSGMLMLRHLGEQRAADRLEAAVARVVAAAGEVTCQLRLDADGATAVGTRELAEAVVRAL